MSVRVRMELFGLPSAMSPAGCAVAMLGFILWACPAPAQPRCASSFMHQETAAEKPPPADILQSRGAITIPLAVHIVWHTPEENISDAQVQSQVDVLNRDFRAANPEIGEVPALFHPWLADLEIEFCLVAITRTRTSVAGIGNDFADGRRRVCYSSLGGHDAIDPEHYLNAWVSGRSDGAFGDAPLPGQAPAGEEGIFVSPSHFGTLGSVTPPYHLGRTATHEVGHYFNLKHPWGEGFEDLLCLTDDEVADTPEQAFNYQAECPSHPSLSCGTPDMFMNFMNYTNDACMSFFTAGQKARLMAALQLYRSGLLESSCLPVSSREVKTETEVGILGNPAGGQVALRLPPKEVFEMAIFDAAGRLVFYDEAAKGPIFFVDTRSFISGIYYIKIRNGGNLHAKKLIIAR